ncbi:hypothetical protein B0H15DRAFT_958488 [Mycena belliarum]|uniref:Uncharacterized protein n=1 Tax=Mycena belliarum TaxID=1033014 RepID=A0AAD6XDE9_9AGAR|nr:hypothetical protein B0H15DRAFT_958488 [Mycena belliae]
MSLHNPPSPDSLFSDEPTMPDVDVKVISYRVSTATTISGLPPDERYKVVRAYRARLYDQVADSSAPELLMYDLSCQYYKNMHALEVANTPHTDSEDSDDSDPEGPPPLEPRVIASDIADRDGEGVERTWVGDRRWSSLPIGKTGGEEPEQAWSNMNPPASSTLKMGEGDRRNILDDGGDIHTLRIISFCDGVRDVKCDCQDGRHSAYERRRVYAFANEQGDVIVRKTKTMLLHLE